ncbi:MAG: ATP-binding protein [Patescibacteria group bacterium]
MMLIPSLSGRSLASMALLFIAYILGAQVFSYIYTFVPTSPALIWPASGIALAGLIIGGIGLWPAIFLASLTHQLLVGSTLFVGLGLAAANAIQAVLAAWILKRWGFKNSFSKVPDTVVFIMVAIIVTVAVPALGTLVFLLAERAMPRGIGGTFIPWWIGQMLSVLIVTPLLVRWIPQFSFSRTKAELFEAWLSIGSVTVVGILLYFTPYREVAQIPLVYLILIPFIWIALRIGPRFMTLALFINATLALAGTAFVFLAAGTPGTLGAELLQAQIFIIVISLIFLVLVTVAEERKDTANDLRHNVRNLEDAVERIRKEDEAKSRFIATLAHELRNPLAPLMSSLEIMKIERSSAPETRALAEGMESHIRTMRHLLDDLLDISRISREKLSLAKEHIDLETIIRRSERSTASFIESRDHTLTSTLPEEALWLEADPVRLEQVFVNLLNNAAKYTEPGGRIEVLAEARGAQAVVTIADSGIGMQEELLEHVFEPFYQIEHAGKLSAGLGIGLSLTRTLVEMHGGTILAESGGPGLGSRFTVRLPLARESRKTEVTPALPADRPASGFRILVVDDNRAAADALVRLLTLRGNHAEAAYTGEEAVKRAPAYAADVILLDIGLPDMEGYDVARALRSDATVTSVLIALTGFGQESDIRKAAKAGFDHHLTKPAGLAEIEEILATIERKEG